MNGRFYAWAAAAMVVGAGLLLALRPAADAAGRQAVLLGCALATGNGLLAAWVNQRALGRDLTRFMLWSGIGHGVRVLALLLAVLSAFVYEMPDARGFAAATFVGYVCFLAAEIAVLQKRQ